MRTTVLRKASIFKDFQDFNRKTNFIVSHIFQMVWHPVRENLSN